jgi:drug/metabolite transporter (DMT)-like permease
MNQTSVGIIVFSALVHAIWNLLAKGSSNKVVFLWLALICGNVIFLPVLVYVFLSPGEHGVYWQMVALTGVFHALYLIYLAKTYEAGDISHTYPIVRTYPLFSLLPAYLAFGDTLSPFAIVGILLTMLGIYSINLRRVSLRELLQPISRWREPAMQLALLTSFMSVGYSMADKAGVMRTEPFVFYYLKFFPQMLLVTPYILWRISKREILREWSNNKWNILIAGVFMLVSYVATMMVMKTENLAYILSLRQISVLFGVVFGIVILNERYGWVRFAAATLIFIGSYLIGIA